MSALVDRLTPLLPAAVQNWRRRRLARRLPDGPLRAFYRRPAPPRATPLRNCVFAVLDFETTGLDPAHDHVISIGLVEIHGLAIPLDRAWHTLIHTPRRLPEKTTVIHGLTDDRLAAGGEPLQTAMASLVERLAGKVLVAHHAAIELGFLRRICRDLYAAPLLVPWVDTQRLARRCIQRGEVTPRASELRLFNLRQRFHLPDYTAHDALYDALATAELFLALVAELDPRGNARLRDLRPATA